jgi:hypothetical protein
MNKFALEMVTFKYIHPPKFYMFYMFDDNNAECDMITMIPAAELQNS